MQDRIARDPIASAVRLFITKAAPPDQCRRPVFEFNNGSAFRLGAPQQDLPWFPTRRRRTQSPRPKFDGERLYFGGVLCRDFRKKAAPEQADVLAACQSAGWPRTGIKVPAACVETLNATIQRINRGLKPRLFRLCGDGTGKGVRWEKVVDAQ
jgi:hypothetical protein